MRHKTVMLILSILALAFLPSYLSAQETPPPPCCNKEDPPPPGTPLQGEATILSQVIVSDLDLNKAGMTRSQFLDALAAVLFSDTDQTYSLLIPIYTQITAGDGTTSLQLSLFEIKRSQIAIEVINTLDFVLITDGEMYVVVVFGGTASD